MHRPHTAQKARTASFSIATASVSEEGRGNSEPESARRATDVAYRLSYHDRSFRVRGREQLREPGWTARDRSDGRLVPLCPRPSAPGRPLRVGGTSCRFRRKPVHIASLAGRDIMDRQHSSRGTCVGPSGYRCLVLVGRWAGILECPVGGGGKRIAPCSRMAQSSVTPGILTDGAIKVATRLPVTGSICSLRNKCIMREGV